MILKDIVVTYGEVGKENIVLKALSLEVKEVAIKGIFGEKSSGKTTLLKVLSGRLKPLMGEVKYEKADQTIGVISVESKFKMFDYKFYKHFNKNRSICYRDIQNCKRGDPDLLIIDDVEKLPLKEVSQLLEERKSNGKFNIILSDNLEILKSFTKNISVLEGGQIIT